MNVHSECGSSRSDLARDCFLIAKKRCKARDVDEQRVRSRILHARSDRPRHIQQSGVCRFFANSAARPDGDLRELAHGGFGHAMRDTKNLREPVESDNLIRGRRSIDDGKRPRSKFGLGASDSLQNKIGNVNGTK